MELDFYYDVVCPYAYLASTRIEALAARTGARLRWRPLLLGGLFRHVGANQNPAGLMPPAKAALNLLDMQRYARRAGVGLTMPAAHPRRTVDAMRLLVLADEGVRPALTHALYRAYWVEGRDVADRAVLRELAAPFGLDAGAVDTAEAKAALFAATDAGAALGLFGVPGFGLPELPAASGGPRFYWGQDRMHLVERALLGAPPADAAQPPGLSETRGGATVTFFHDFSSPFSYLASTQIAARCAAWGAELRLRPILVGALFRDIGTPDVPMLAMNPARRAYIGRDLLDWAEHWGVPFRFAETFPLRTVLPLRVAIAAPEATPALYRAAWVDNLDVGDPATVAAVLDAAGLPGADLVARAGADAALKAVLRENTEAARTAGACGVPTFLVEKPGHAPELFWGQDRLDLVGESACR